MALDFPKATLDFGQEASSEYLGFGFGFHVPWKMAVAEELRRSPSVEQCAVFDRLRTMIAVCGDARELVSLCPGRTGPELGSNLFQLERFCDVCPDPWVIKCPH